MPSGTVGRLEVRVVRPDTLKQPGQVDELGGVHALVHQVAEQLGHELLQPQQLAGLQDLRDHRA